MNRRGRKATSVVAAALALVVSACSSSTKAGAPSTTQHPAGAASEPTYTVGVLTDLSGLAATDSLTYPLGVKAGIGVAAGEGFKIRYVVADTQTSPTVVLAAARKLVEQDHVFAVLASSALTFAAAPYLASKGIPVIGAANDSTEWITDRNMFSILGTEDYTKVYSQFGQVFKKLGVTNLASIGYSISPSSSESAKGEAISAQAAGIRVGYLNANFPFGSTNVGPVALEMKNAGVNGVTAAITTATEFALISQLRNDGVHLQAGLMSTGYGGDLTSGGPASQQIAEGLYFESSYEPVEMHTAATQKLVDALKNYAGVTGDPTFAEYQGYLSVDALVHGLEAAGPDPTQSSLIDAMLGMTDYAGAGLFGSHSLGFALDQRGQVGGADNCTWITKYSGQAFHLVPGLDPVCGQTLPGKKVSG